MDQNNQSIQRFDIYSLVESFPEEVLSKYPKALLYDDSTKERLSESSQQYSCLRKHLKIRTILLLFLVLFVGLEQRT